MVENNLRSKREYHSSSRLRCGILLRGGQTRWLCIRYCAHSGHLSSRRNEQIFAIECRTYRTHYQWGMTDWSTQSWKGTIRWFSKWFKRFCQENTYIVKSAGISGSFILKEESSDGRVIDVGRAIMIVMSWRQCRLRSSCRYSSCRTNDGESAHGKEAF